MVTLLLEPAEGERPDVRSRAVQHGDAFGRGEVAVSMSGSAGDAGAARALHPAGRCRDGRRWVRRRWGRWSGIRGPFGTAWGLEEIGGRRPTSSSWRAGSAWRPCAGAIDGPGGTPAGGPRSRRRAGRRPVPGPGPLRRRSGDLGAGREPTWPCRSMWARRGGRAQSAWSPSSWRPRPSTRPERVALLCGPEIMMRFGGRALVDRGVDPGRIRVSLERNMQCGVGLCGHCQLGPLLVCRDGPVVRYGGLADALFMERHR